MKKNRCSLAVCCVLLCALSAPGAYAGEESLHYLTPPAKTINPSNFTPDLALFSAKTPVLVFEVGDEDVVTGTIRGQMVVYDNAEGENTLRDAPALSRPVFLREVRDQARRRGKMSYTVELAEDFASLSENPPSLAGLPPDVRWILRGSSRDKSMLRNGLAYMVGRELMPEATPETRFCEVFFSVNGIYQYEGLYILAETGERIVRNLAAPSEAGILLRHLPTRENRDDLVRTGNKFFAATKIWSAEALTADDKREIGVELEKVESLLNSVHPNAFLQYQTYIDENSAVGYYLLNSILLNVSEDDMVPASLVKNKEGKFQYLPDWNFDLAVDNAPVRMDPLPFERKRSNIETPSILRRRLPVWRILEEGGGIEDLRMYPIYEALNGDRFLWLDRLFMSRSFLFGLYSRFNECRNVFFPNTRPLWLVDALAAELGPAVERDWIRWRREYSAADGVNSLAEYIDAKGAAHQRQTMSYDEELVKVAHCLRKQDAFLSKQLNDLYWMSGDLYDKRKSGTRQAGYSLATLVGMVLIIFILTRKI